MGNGMEKARIVLFIHKKNVFIHHFCFCLFIASFVCSFVQLLLLLLGAFMMKERIQNVAGWFNVSDVYEYVQYVCGMYYTINILR